MFGTREDYLIPSACLNSTVSGLVSRTVFNTDHIGPDDFHGAKFYAELGGATSPTTSWPPSRALPGRRGTTSGGCGRSPCAVGAPPELTGRAGPPWREISRSTASTT